MGKLSLGASCVVALALGCGGAKETDPETPAPPAAVADAPPPTDVTCPAGTKRVEESSKDGRLVECHLGDRVRHGPMALWLADGTLVDRSEWKNGKMHGTYRRWNEHGKKLWEIEVSADLPDGKATYWDGEGTIVAQGRMSKGAREGTWIEEPRARGKHEKNFRAGVRAGTWRSWNEKGELVDTRTFRGGVIESIGGTKVAPAAAVTFADGDVWTRSSCRDEEPRAGYARPPFHRVSACHQLFDELQACAIAKSGADACRERAVAVYAKANQKHIKLAPMPLPDGEKLTQQACNQSSQRMMCLDILREYAACPNADAAKQKACHAELVRLYTGGDDDDDDDDLDDLGDDDDDED